MCELVGELYQALGQFSSIQASNCVPLLPNCFGYKAIPAFGPDERNEMEYKMETSGTKHETTFAFNHKFNFGQFALSPPPPKYVLSSLNQINFSTKSIKCSSADHFLIIRAVFFAAKIMREKKHLQLPIYRKDNEELRLLKIRWASTLLF